MPFRLHFFIPATYHFDLRTKDGFVPGEEGEDFSGIEAARREAANTILELAKPKLRDGLSEELSMTVRDHNGSELFTASVSVAFRQSK